LMQIILHFRCSRYTSTAISTMFGSRSWRALMRRNFIYRKRNLIGTLLEFLLPIAGVAILVAIKKSVQDTKDFAPQTVPANFPDNSDAFITLSFSDYLVAIQAPRTCYRNGTNGDGSPTFRISGIPKKNSNWQVPFVKCDFRNCQYEGEDASQKYCEYNLLALAPSSESDSEGFQRAKAFESYILNRYPVLNTTLAAKCANSTLPFSYSLVQVFPSAVEIETYVKQDKYGENGFPKIAMGVIFKGNSPTSYDYVLRLNSTNFYPQSAPPRIHRACFPTLLAKTKLAPPPEIKMPLTWETIPILAVTNMCTMASWSFSVW